MKNRLILLLLGGFLVIEAIADSWVMPNDAPVIAPSNTPNKTSRPESSENLQDKSPDKKIQPKIKKSLDPSNNPSLHVDQPVGRPDPRRIEKRITEIQTTKNSGGLLSRKGAWTFEPAIHFSHAQVNRLTFSGVEVVDAFLIGILEAQDTDRDVVSLLTTARFGISNWVELELKLPYVIRKENFAATIPQVNSGAAPVRIERQLESEGFGDLELALNFQLNQPTNGPYMVGALRYKTTTGKGPFDIKHDDQGIETELATGTGFPSVESNVNVLFQSDPAIYFFNSGYLFNVAGNVKKQLGDQFVQFVNPGNALRLSFGMAYAVNSSSSFTLGYKHDFIRQTKSRINDIKVSNSSLDIGSILFGFGFQVSKNKSLNIGVELGITDDSPDTQISIRIPMHVTPGTFRLYRRPGMR